jgi:putative FmdB family regulatory protein
MPIYTYRCTSCGVQFDQQQKFSDTPLTRCPECSKKTLQKVFQPVGIVFKGSGFYATDHRSPSGQGRSTSKEKSGDGESGAAKPASSESESGSEKSSSTSKENQTSNE